MSSILVLGGAGYIGSHTVYELISGTGHLLILYLKKKILMESFTLLPILR